MRFLVLIMAFLFACDRPAKPLPRTPASLETAVLAGGCFWGMEGILRKIPGVTETEVGYAHGAEAVRVVFDPAKLSYETLLDRWFFRMHDPTTKNRQGNDVGAQYRSAIFYTSDAQKQTAEASKAKAAVFWQKPITTEIVQATTFAPAEEHHQDYLEKNPGGYTCHFMRDEVL